MILNHGHSHWKWYNMAEITSAYKHGRYEQIWRVNLHAKSYFTNLATQDERSDKHDW